MSPLLRIPSCVHSQEADSRITDGHGDDGAKAPLRQPMARPSPNQGTGDSTRKEQAGDPKIQVAYGGPREGGGRGEQCRVGQIRADDRPGFPLAPCHQECPQQGPRTNGSCPDDQADSEADEDGHGPWEF